VFPLAPLIVIAGAYLLGSIPFGVLIARRRGVDIRREGSGNVGATNVTRVLGARAGAVVLVLDAAKGALPVWWAEAWLGLDHLVALAGAAAIFGHCFSPWLGGKGGKGVATSLGVFAVFAPPLALVGLATFLFVAGRTRVPALGSLAAMAAATVFAFATGASGPVQVLALATTCLLVYTHRGNLGRLLARG
jgi:acyl phosphate:glycerol-3-phosphate acyltransferase